MIKIRYYFDTSIWLDLFEDRNEPNLPKGKLVEDLINTIVKNNDIIVYSDLIIDELSSLGYSTYEIEELFKPFLRFLIFTEHTEKHLGKGKDLAAKRKVPLFDAMHALIARDTKAIMVTRDKHFMLLVDIVKSKRPEDVT